MGNCPDCHRERNPRENSLRGLEQSKSTFGNGRTAKASILLELIRSRRSIRFFRDIPIPDEHIMMILEGARWAPSPANAQPWELIVIKDLGVKKKLLETMRKVGRAVREKYAKFPWDVTSRDRELISKAPVVVAVCADFHPKELEKYDLLPLEHKKEIVKLSVAAAIQNMMLMATSLGVGSLWVTPLSDEEVKKLLHVPEALQLVALLVLGHPADDALKRVSRKPIEEMMHYDDYSKTQP